MLFGICAKEGERARGKECAHSCVFFYMYEIRIANVESPLEFNAVQLYEPKLRRRRRKKSKNEQNYDS